MAPRPRDTHRSFLVEAENNWPSVGEKVASNWAIVAMVQLDCTRPFVEVRIAGNFETVAATVASNSPPLLFRVFVVAAKAANNLAVSAVSVADASRLAAAAGTIGVSNWSAIVATIANTDYSAATARKTETFASAEKRVERKSAFVAAGAMIASSFDLIAEESGTKSLMVAKVTVANSWRSVFAAMTEEKNLAAEETAASKHWVVEAKVENSSRVVAAAKDDRIQRAVEERIAHMESAAAAAAAVETVASNSALFEERIASKVNAAAEKLAHNWQPPEEKAENN